MSPMNTRQNMYILTYSPLDTMLVFTNSCPVQDSETGCKETGAQKDKWGGENKPEGHL